MLSLVALAALAAGRADACTNVIITKGASADGSCMVSYAADSHWLYGELYSSPRGSFAPGSMLPKVEAAISFAKSGHKTIIASLENAKLAIEGKSGTIVVKE